MLISCRHSTDPSPTFKNFFRVPSKFRFYGSQIPHVASFFALLAFHGISYPRFCHLIASLNQFLLIFIKWLKSFSVPSQRFRHILNRLPLLQGSLRQNKGSSGNNVLRRNCQRGSKIHSSSKTSLFLKKIDPEFVLQKILSKFFFPVSKNEKLQII